MSKTTMRHLNAWVRNHLVFALEYPICGLRFLDDGLARTGGRSLKMMRWATHLKAPLAHAFYATELEAARRNDWLNQHLGEAYMTHWQVVQSRYLTMEVRLADLRRAMKKALVEFPPALFFAAC